MQDTSNKPWITCFMLYYGRYDVAQEAVESFLGQTYSNKRLIIVNTHPDPVYFENDYESITVYNLFDMPLGEKYKWAIDHIDTAWCVPWDSDDIWLPWHIENIAANIPASNGPLPRKAGQMYRFSSVHNVINGIGGPTWQMFIFETEALKGISSPHENYHDIKWDEQIIDHRKYPLSFIYRWGMNIPHGSDRRSEKEREKYNAQMRKKLSEVSLKKPFRPCWKRDYIEDARAYLSSPSAKKIMKIIDIDLDRIFRS